MTDTLVLPAHGLEEPHVPVPSGHAPRLEAAFGPGALYVYERDNAEAYLSAANPVEVRR